MPHNVLVLNLLVSLELIESRVEVIQQRLEGGRVTEVCAQKLEELFVCVWGCGEGERERRGGGGGRGRERERERERERINKSTVLY